MKIQMSISKTVFEIDQGRKVRMESIFGPENAVRIETEIKRASELKAVIDGFAAIVQARVPGLSVSFYVRPARGERKVPGFDKLIYDKSDPLGLDRFVKTVTKGEGHKALETA
jgi:hypothetical protein